VVVLAACAASAEERRSAGDPAAAASARDADQEAGMCTSGFSCWRRRSVENNRGFNMSQRAGARVRVRVRAWSWSWLLAGRGGDVQSAVCRADAAGTFLWGAKVPSSPWPVGAARVTTQPRRPP
jgi:hypothetical protein